MMNIFFQRSILFLLFVILCSKAGAQPVFPYKNPALPVDQRVADLLARMTADEKFWQLFMIPGDLSIGKEKLKNGIFGLEVDARGETTDAAGQMLTYGGSNVASHYAAKVNEIQRFFVTETRLGIPIIPFAESLHGLGMGGSTSFPQSIALAATWDTNLMRQVSLAIAREVRSRGIRQVLDPVINIARDVRWGRVEETYGEDPYLTSMMGFCYMDAFEQLGVIATPKHFAVNVGDGGRDSYPIHYNERLMEEVYYPAFKYGFQKAGARSVMSAYNSFDGVPCTASHALLNEKLKKEWGFEGFVISDACAVGGANVLHYTAADYTEATEDAIEGGLDVIFQTDYEHYKLFKEAFDKGLIPTEVIDAAVARVLKAKFQLGLFENPYVDESQADYWNGHASHMELALEAARKSVVLLDNKKQTLPLTKKFGRIAVIGEDATEARLGGYSGPGINKVNILEGIRKKAGEGTEIVYSAGRVRSIRETDVIAETSLFHREGNQLKSGLKGDYFSNIHLKGTPAVSRTDSRIAFGWTLYSPDPALAFDCYSVRWTGILKPEASGSYQIGVEGNDGYRLYLDEKLLVDNWQKSSYSVQLAEVKLEAGKEYPIRLEYYENSGSARIKLVWKSRTVNEWQAQIAEAVENARLSDVAVVVAGIHEGEFNDRAFLSLPGKQEELIRAVSETGKPVVVVLIGGSAITMGAWKDQADAIVDAWYPGEVGGDAVADILFGNSNPSGRLPITFPVFEGQLPLVYNHKPTGRGDDYTDLTGMPLFPFGYGLSYTQFMYDDLRFSTNSISSGESAKISFYLTNTGAYAGEEVCQLYIRDELASVARPVKELKAFQRVKLAVGERKEVTFTITPDMLQMLDINLKPVIEAGDFRIMVGASSADIRLRGILKVTE